MYMKNFDSKLVATEEYEGLKQDGKFIFPHGVKYFAWFLLLACIVTSCVILIYYGISFGMIKTYLWVTSVIGMIMQSILITAPVRITIMSFFKGVFLKLRVRLIKRPIEFSLLSHPYNPSKKKQVLNFRKYNAHLYKPTPLYKLQYRLEKVKYNMELRNLTVDVITHILFLITVFYLVLFGKTTLGYLSTSVIENLVVKGSYTNSIPFTNITTYDTLLEYLNKTLLPALLLNYRDYWKLHLAFEYKGDRNQTLNGTDWPKSGSNFYARGWTMDPAVKLIGKPRIRQIRVKADSCKQHKDVESRNPECAAELTFLNVETNNFSLRWEPWSDKELTPSEEEPWIYKSGWETKTMPIFAKFSNYPWGGYVLNLGRSVNDSRIILEYLDEFQWIDTKTRAVLIEFTTYCVNVNVFNVVTLIAEKSAIGYIIPSYKIETCEFLFLSAELEVLTYTMIILFSLLLFFFSLRESIRIHRTTVWPYFRRTSAVLDLAIIFFGVVSLIFVLLRNSYVASLLKELELSDNNKFVSFNLASYWHKLSVYIEAFLVCLASFKIFRLLAYRVIFFQLQTTLSCCCKQFVDLVIQIFILTAGFALFFHLCLNVYAYNFSNFPVSFSTMIARCVVVDDGFDFSIFKSSPWYLAPLFFGIFVIVITILFMNLFIAVICLYFTSVRKISLINKYRILSYLKHILRSKKDGDLLNIKGDSGFVKNTRELLRLKGGGSKASKGKTTKVKKIRKREVKKTIPEEEELTKIYLRDFVKERRYEGIIFQTLAEERALTMKYLTMSSLASNEDEKKASREKALPALFVAKTSSNRHPEEEEARQDQYIFVVKKSGREIVKKKRLFEMKKTIEEYAKQKGWIAYGDSFQEWISAERLKNNIDLLCKKLDDLLKKSSKIENIC